MEQAVDDADFALLHRSAHSVKSTSRLLGAEHLSDLCAELEQDAEPGTGNENRPSSEPLRIQVQNILAEYDRVHTALQSADFNHMTIQGEPVCT